MPTETPSITQSRTIDAGADLTVVLCSNPSTGYNWDDPVIGDPAVLEVVHELAGQRDAPAARAVGPIGPDRGHAVAQQGFV